MYFELFLIFSVNKLFSLCSKENNVGIINVLGVALALF
jgi:hypothetical protein